MSPVSPEVLAWIAAVVAGVAGFLAAAAFWQSRRAARLLREAAVPQLRTEVRALGREATATREQLESALGAMRSVEDALARNAAAMRAEQPEAGRGGDHPLAQASKTSSAVAPVDEGPDPITPSAPGAAGIPVELESRDAIRRSPSLAPRAFLVPRAEGGAELYVNPEATIDHVAIREWTRIYEFRGETPYVRYTTETPAIIDWNATAERGQLLRRGIAIPLND